MGLAHHPPAHVRRHLAASRDRCREPKSSEQLLPQDYDELCGLSAAKVAQEKSGHTLNATVLVHEAWLRLSEESKSIEGLWVAIY